MRVWATSCLHLSGPSTDTDLHIQILLAGLSIGSGDIIILAGDIVDDHPDIHWPFLARCFSGHQVITVDGNHDTWYYEPYFFPPQRWAELNLFGASVQVENLRITGFTSPNFAGPPWAIHHPIEGLSDSEIFNLSSPPVYTSDILVCHHPFYWQDPTGTHCSDERLTRILSRSTISHIIFGHVHPEYQSNLVHNVIVPAGRGTRQIQVHNVSHGVTPQGRYLYPLYCIGEFPDGP